MLTLKHRQHPNCAYCKDTLSESVYICSGCETYYHTDCLEELGKCAVLGCEKIFSSKLANIIKTPSKSTSKGKPYNNKKRHGPELSPILPGKGQYFDKEFYKIKQERSRIKRERAFFWSTAGGAAFLFIYMVYVLVYALALI